MTHILNSQSKCTYALEKKKLYIFLLQGHVT